MKIFTVNFVGLESEVWGFAYPNFYLWDVLYSIKSMRNEYFVVLNFKNTLITFPQSMVRTYLTRISFKIMV